MSRAQRQDGLFEPGLFLQFFLAAQAVGQLIERAIQQSKLTASEYAALSAIDELGPVTPADVARLTGVPRPTLTAQIEKLVQAQLVRRRDNPDDGRSYTLELTARGRRTKDACGRALLVAGEALDELLEEETAQLVASLGRLRDAAEAALAAANEPS